MGSQGAARGCKAPLKDDMDQPKGEPSRPPGLPSVQQAQGAGRPSGHVAERGPADTGEGREAPLLVHIPSPAGIPGEGAFLTVKQRSC